MSSVHNTNDGSSTAPRLRIGLSLLTVADSPEWSAGPKGSASEVLAAIKSGGFEAVQTRDPEAAIDAGLTPTALRRIDRPADAMAVATSDRDRGFDCTTLHVGTDFEDDNESRALIEAIVEASTALNYPLYVETHRATATQDMKRTLDLVKSCPDVRFNGDFSHWYTGGEMTYGSVDSKIDRLQPVIERTRLVHGRISSPGAIQIPIRGGGQANHEAVFRKVWTRSFAAFARSAAPGDYFCFYPELLSPSYFGSLSGSAAPREDRQGQLGGRNVQWQSGLEGNAFT